MNIYYIQAAILQATGTELTIDETIIYLLEEGMITPSVAQASLFNGYEQYTATGNREY